MKKYDIVSVVAGLFSATIAEKYAKKIKVV